MSDIPANGDSRLDRIERSIDHMLNLAARHDEQIAALSGVADRILTIVEGLTQVSTAHQEEIRNMNRKVAEAAEAARLAAESGKATDDRLNALIGFVAGWKSHPPQPPTQ